MKINKTPIMLLECHLPITQCFFGSKLKFSTLCTVYIKDQIKLKNMILMLKKL